MEGQGASELLGLTAVGLNLPVDAAGGHFVEDAPGRSLVAHIEREGCQHGIACHAVIVTSGALLLPLLALQHPVAEVLHPLAHLLAVLGGERLRALEQGQSVQRLDQRIGIEHAVGAAAVPVVPLGYLRIVEVGVHAGGGIQEPHPHQLNRLGGVRLVPAEIPHQRQGVDAPAGGTQPVAVVAVQLGVREAVAVDVGQSVGLRGVGPVVSRQAHIVVPVSAGGHVGLVRHAQWPALQE